MRERDGGLRIAAYFPEDFDEVEEIVKPEMDFRHEFDPEMARTVFDGDKIVMIGGVFPLWQGVGTAFVMLDKNRSPRHLRWLILAARRVIAEWLSEGRFHRIQADVRKDEPKALKFVRACGFQSEGDMKAYGLDGSDYERFAIVKER